MELYVFQFDGKYMFFKLMEKGVMMETILRNDLMEL